MKNLINSEYLELKVLLLEQRERIKILFIEKFTFIFIKKKMELKSNKELSCLN